MFPRRASWYVTAFLMLANLILAMTPASMFAAPLAQSDESDSAVDGSSYTSPTFGYYIEWGREWDVTDELNDESLNRLVLSNQTSTVYLEGVFDSSNLEECVETLVDTLEGTEGVDDVIQFEDDEGDPLGGERSSRAWAVYNFTYTSEGDSFDFSEYVDCRPIEDGESILVISMLTATDIFLDELDSLNELLDGLSIDGSAAPETSNSDDVDEPVENGEFASIEQMVNSSSGDIDAFWEREFPRISDGEEYTPPADVVTFAEDVKACNATLEAGSTGPVYCPINQTIYYDLPWADDQTSAFGSMSLIAMDIAHEVGHHVQLLMEWKECLNTPCLDPTEMTSQEFELQADCFSGAWMADAETRGRMGSFDIESNIAQYALVLGDPVDNVADRGAHGSAASRTFWLLNGYFFGVDTCLTVSAATDPARNGTGAPQEEAETEPAAAPTAEPSPNETFAVGEEYAVEFSDQTLVMSVISSERTDTLAGDIEAEGTFLVVYVTVERDGDAPGPIRYASFIVKDSEGNEYRLDEAATDELLRTALPAGIDENLDLDASYNVAFVFDVDTNASGFIFSTSSGEGIVELDE